MTPIPPTGSDPRGDDAVDHILAELRDTPEADAAEHDEGPLEALDAALAALSTDALSAEAQAAVERLMASGEGLTPAARQRMITAAERGLRRQRLAHGTLASLLAIHRDEEGLPTAVLARELGLEEAELLSIESGERDVRALSALQIATWVTRLAIGRKQAIQALRRSLGLVATAPKYAQRADLHKPTQRADDVALVTAVDELLIARAAQRLQDIPGYVAYDLRRFTELTGADPTQQLGMSEAVLSRLSLCRTPRRDHHFASDMQRIADDCGISPAVLANAVRRMDVLTGWVGAAANGPRLAVPDEDGSQHPFAVADQKHPVDQPRLLAAARDTTDERTVAELPPTGTTGLPRWLAHAVETFWGEHGPPTEFPRDLELPLLTRLPVAVVELRELTVASLTGWLAERHLPALAPVADRRLRACLLAYAGLGVVFLDASDTPAQRRVSLAHEGAHFIVDYLLPRQEVTRRRPKLLEVLDGLREPTANERVDAAAFDVPIGVHTHLLERTPDGGWRDPQAGHAEHHAERVALELLAPQQVVLRRFQEAGLETIEEFSSLLQEEFGLPPATAGSYAGQLARLAPPRPRGLLGLLDLRNPADTADRQTSEGPDDATSDASEGPESQA
jgi:hypothetical protein